MSKSFHIDSSMAITVTMQLEEQFRLAIERGELLRGSAVPSVRQLAQYLRVNPNTVLKVYGNLEREGWLHARRARGYFVHESPPIRQPGSIRTAFLDEVLARAAHMGLDSNELAVGLLARDQWGQPREQNVTGILLVECNRFQLDRYAQELRIALPGVAIESVLLDVLLQHGAEAQDREPVGVPEVIVTTVFHAHEIQCAFVSGGPRIFALVPRDSLKLLQRLDVMEPDHPIAAVCETHQSAAYTVQSLSAITSIAVVPVGIKDSDGLRKLQAQGVKTAVCSAALEDRLLAWARLANWNVTIISEDGPLSPIGVRYLQQWLGVNQA